MHLAIDSPHLAAKPDPFAASGLLGLLLSEQQTTAADKFAQWHDRATSPVQARYYRDLIPLSIPGEGEQYAFSVDLDSCSGCKACVTACHNLNGLEDEETWRGVGLLHGGTSQLPVLQHVTTACHHCLEPPCLDGCPVNAYEKDPVTGIVRHLDDQCIGCQYCILKCPYDVPKYSHRLGIVRKCDMCRNRLAVGEAPACVQACPNQAIRITVVNKQEIAENAEANLFLPGAPEPGYTLPTTSYKTRKALPANLLPADYYSATPQHAHWPLVLMLVLTQMSVGACCVDQALSYVKLGAVRGHVETAQTVNLWATLVLGMIGLTASIFHLGRPWRAYRAVLGWRTSWLSREVLAFGAFAGLASAYAGLSWLAPVGWCRLGDWQHGLGAAVAISGLAGVACSTMIYASTRRVFWNPAYTGLRFLLTCLILGIPVALLMQLCTAAWLKGGAFGQVMKGPGVTLCAWLVCATGAKLLSESAIFCWLGSRTFTPLRRTALLMSSELCRITCWRFATGTVGGIVLPGILLAIYAPATGKTLDAPAAIVVVATLLSTCFAGELLERYLFFTAVVAPKMPGAPAT